MEGKNILILSGIGIAVWGAFKLFGNRANGANSQTAELTATAEQAARFYDLFGVVRIGSLAYSTPILKSETLARVYNLAREIEDWPELQRKFTNLCGGNYTILEAAKTSLNTSEYSQFMDIVSATNKGKRIYAKAAMKISGLLPTVPAFNFNANEYIGRVLKDSGTQVSFWKDGAQYLVKKDSVILK